MKTPEEVASIILSGQAPHMIDGADSVFAKKLARLLEAQGYTDAKSYSECSVASYEAHLENRSEGNHHARVCITSAYLLGSFVQIDTYKHHSIF